VAQDRLTRLAGAYVAYVQALAAGAGFPAPDALRSQLLALLAPVASAPPPGVAADELEEARFALVAWADEVILKASWPGHEEWLRAPLQMQLYRTTQAGNEFFAHLARLRPDQNAAREVYFTVLALGFEGQYQGQAAERRALTVRAYDELRAANRLLETARESQLAPDAYALEIELPRRPTSGLWLGLGGLAVAMVVVYGVLWLTLHAVSGDVALPKGL
jgi:type VI secretion system protein ImpK